MIRCLIKRLGAVFFVHRVAVHFEEKAIVERGQGSTEWYKQLLEALSVLMFCEPVFIFYIRQLSSFRYNGILVLVRTSFGLRRRGGKTYNVST